MDQIVGQLILAASEASVNCYAISPCYVSWGRFCSLGVLLVGGVSLLRLLYEVGLINMLLFIIVKLSFQFTDFALVGFLHI